MILIVVETGIAGKYRLKFSRSRWYSSYVESFLTNIQPGESSKLNSLNTNITIVASQRLELHSTQKKYILSPWICRKYYVSLGNDDDIKKEKNQIHLELSMLTVSRWMIRFECKP